MPHPAGPETPAPARRATLREVLSAVVWSFFGVRKGRHMQRDAVSIRPHQVILAGLAVAALFVLLLILAVNLIVRAAG
jgi:hypothetical protein